MKVSIYIDESHCIYRSHCIDLAYASRRYMYIYMHTQCLCKYVYTLI